MRSDSWQPNRIEQRRADIVQAIEQIRNYVAGETRDSFLSDKLRQDAVTRQLLIVAEATDKIFELEERQEVSSDRRIAVMFPLIPWRKIRDFGVLVRHVYGKEDPRELWHIATGGDLDQLESALCSL